MAARVAGKLAERRAINQQSGGGHTTQIGAPIPAWRVTLERSTVVILATGVLSLLWMIARAIGWIAGPPNNGEIAVIVAVWSVLFAALSAVGLASTLGQ